eukprot:COSAG02_NODE_3693_length_6376_cov_8.749881_1_plen_25_part_10
MREAASDINVLIDYLDPCTASRLLY